MIAKRFERVHAAEQAQSPLTAPDNQLSLRRPVPATFRRPRGFRLRLARSASA
jgi:hypothetical protein